MPDLGQNCEQEAEVFPFQTEIAQVILSKMSQCREFRTSGRVMTLGLEVRGIPPDLDDMYVNEDPEFWEEKFSQTAVLYNGPASDNAIASRYLGRFGTESPDEDKHLGYTDDELELDEFWENARYGNRVTQSSDETLGIIYVEDETEMVKPIDEVDIIAEEDQLERDECCETKAPGNSLLHSPLQCTSF